MSTPAPAPPMLMTTADVARLCKTTERTVLRWRAEGTGPAYIRMGRLIRYIPATVARWVATEATKETK